MSDKQALVDWVKTFARPKRCHPDIYIVDGFGATFYLELDLSDVEEPDEYPETVGKCDILVVPVMSDDHEAQATISNESGKWFVCFAVEVAAPLPTKNTARVGIDLGLKSFVTTSDGESLGDSRSLENTLPELRRRQRALSRCKRGSGRRKIVKQGVVRLHAKVRNVRLDMHHKVARSLVNRYAVIAAESLNVSGLLGNRRLARRIADAGWYSFTRILCNSAESAGGMVILVDPKNTSQECSACGAIGRKSLAVRVHKCACGCELDRDHNAALNVLARASPKSRNVDSLHGSKSRQRKLMV